MATQITNKQVKIVDNVDFNNKEIENAIIDATKNNITNLDTGLVNDVQVNGTSVVSNKVANIKLKTVNGNDINGEGNVAIVTNHAFNPNWNNSGSYTTLDFCDSVNADPNAIVGMSYIGTLKCSDIPIPTIGSVKQGDATVKIIGQGQSSKIITIELSSSSTYPYKWQITYHSHTIDEPGWIGFQPELPSQSGQSGKFLTTNGTTMSWETVGSGGSSNYNDLTNKPSINNTTLSGNKSADDLGLQSTIDTDNKLNANLINGLSTVATSGSYNDLLNKPTLAAVATSGSYTDLTDKPTIPTVNNSTITITQGGVTKGTFTLNQNSASTINLDGSQDLSNYILKPTIITDANSSNLSIAANTIYKFTNALSALNITSVETSDYESVIYFTTGSSIIFTDSSGIKWGGGLIPALEINTIYCISIRNGLAEIDKFGTTI